MNTTVAERDATFDVETRSPVEASYAAGRDVLAGKTKKERKADGQYLTPPPVARYMAALLDEVREGDVVLEPALGSGTLAAAVIERAVAHSRPARFRVVGFETDPTLLEAARERLEKAAEHAAGRGVTVELDLRGDDFLLAHLQNAAPSLFSPSSAPRNGAASSGEAAGDGAPSPGSTSDADAAAAGGLRYDHVIANPPYFKLKPGDPRREAAEGFRATSNVYAVFMELCARLLRKERAACFIVPRSFCSGAYFGKFRRYLTRVASLERIHLFDSRQDAFEAGEVLQENVVLTFRRGTGKPLPDPQQDVVISNSEGAADLGASRRTRTFPLHSVLGGTPSRPVFRLPTSDLDAAIIQAVDRWPGSLEAHGLQVSTGPVVVFRSREALRGDVRAGESVPLLWLHNVEGHHVDLGARRAGKAPAISVEAGEKHLVPTANYVLMRRFTAKEEARRMVAAPFLASGFEHAQVGFENHLNYLYREGGGAEESKIKGAPASGLHPDEARGLAALLGSALLDRYMRTVSGHTQVNAGDLRALPLPPLAAIRAIGERVPDAARSAEERAAINRTVFDVLRGRDLLPDDIPCINETRLDVANVQEAQDALQALGLPKQQQNEIAALTLLTLAQLSPETPWSKAQRQSLGITEIMEEMAERYDRRYAPNTRETVRRRVIHQFVDAGVAVRNPDDPTLPTNSPNTHYGLSDAAIRTIRTYGSSEWEDAAQTFLEGKRELIQRHRKRLEKHRVPLTLPSGEEYSLSPGAHNELQAAVVNDFGPEFAPGAKVLYVGDTEDKTLHVETEALEALGFDLTQHDKLPDVVLYDEEEGRLFLVEAVTSHGPIHDMRIRHIEEMIGGSEAEHVYVTAFPDFDTFKNYMSEIAWETEVWLADTPEHMIHFNGDRFLK